MTRNCISRSCCLFVTGMRRSELVGLAFDCVDLDAGRITIRRSVVEITYLKPVLREHGKTESSLRTIAIPATLTEMLRKRKVEILEAALAWRDYQRDPLLVFPGLRGGPSSPQRLSERLRHLMKRAGVTGPSPAHALEAQLRDRVDSCRCQHQNCAIAFGSRLGDDHAQRVHAFDRGRRSGRRRSFREHTESQAVNHKRLAPDGEENSSTTFRGLLPAVHRSGSDRGGAGCRRAQDGCVAQAARQNPHRHSRYPGAGRRR